MGTPDYAKEILEKLLSSEFDVVAIFTQPDKPVGRKKVMTPPPVKVLGEEHNIDIYQPKRLRDSENVEILNDLNPDYIVVAAYGQLLSKEILDIAPSINLHSSVLPKYRGASPIQQALLNGDSETGVTAMLMNEGLDTGDILKIEKLAIDSNWVVGDLYRELTEMAGELTLSTLRDFRNIVPEPQNSSEATHCHKISKSDGEIDFSSADEVVRKYRAFTPWPSIFSENGLKFTDIELHSLDGKHNRGEIISIDGDKVVVGCETGSIVVNRLQPKSKKEMTIKAYLNGKRIGIGDSLL
jgi:methionyl-tRNA formyltransferase